MHQIAFVFPGQGCQSVGMGRALAETSPGRRRRLRPPPMPPSASRSARLAWEGPEEELEPDRERPAGAARRLDRLSRGRPRALGRARRRHPGARLRRRPLDGPVHGARRRRRPRPRRRRPPRARARPADAGVRCRAARAAWPRSSASTTRGSRSSSRRRPAHGIFGVANRNSPGQVVVSGERAGRRGRARHREGPRRQARDRAAGLRRRPLPAHGRGGRRHARASSPASPSATRSRRSSPTPTPARSPPPTAAAPSSWTT